MRMSIIYTRPYVDIKRQLVNTHYIIKIYNHYLSDIIPAYDRSIQIINWDLERNIINI